jgi:hypothetical protein
MMNQALFEQLRLLDGDVTDAAFSPWLDAVAGIAGSCEGRAMKRQDGGRGLFGAVLASEAGAENDQSPRSLGGSGLRLNNMVRTDGQASNPDGLEGLIGLLTEPTARRARRAVLKRLRCRLAGDRTS